MKDERGPGAVGATGLPADCRGLRVVIVATAGWAYKFAPMFGALLAELAVKGTTTYDIEPMSITRSGVVVDLYPGEPTLGVADSVRSTSGGSSAQRRGKGDR